MEIYMADNKLMPYVLGQIASGYRFSSLVGEGSCSAGLFDARSRARATEVHDGLHDIRANVGKTAGSACRKE